jgi:hypothetical protein
MPRRRSAIFLAACLFLLIVPACSGQAHQSSSECFGAACPGQGAIDVRLSERRCGPDGLCATTPLKQQPYLHLIQLGGPIQEHCGPTSDCGGVAVALRTHGWHVGRWRLVAPELRGMKAPEPVTIRVKEHQTARVTLIYRASPPSFK